ncbi:MAG: hypothetical protein PHQ28_02870 [Mycobacterium sp.]|nr:hypothetical protein [Mycobacterium sp.]
MEIGPTALKRKWTRDDILHALEHRHIDYDIEDDIEDDDPPRTARTGWLTPLPPEGASAIVFRAPPTPPNPRWDQGVRLLGDSMDEYGGVVARHVS